MSIVVWCVYTQFTAFNRTHYDVIKWKSIPRYWPFMRGIHRSPVNSPHKGQWRGALMFSFICSWINGWVNNGEAGDLRRHRANYDVILIQKCQQIYQDISPISTTVLCMYEKNTFCCTVQWTMCSLWSYFREPMVASWYGDALSCTINMLWLRGIFENSEMILHVRQLSRNTMRSNFYYQKMLSFKKAICKHVLTTYLNTALLGPLYVHNWRDLYFLSVVFALDHMYFIVAMYKNFIKITLNN